VLPQVLRLGPSAVPLLESVLRGPSGAIHHARCLAADGLGAIRAPSATEALIRALRDSVARELDPVSLEAECVVVNCIAEHLSHRPGSDVTQALVEALSVRAYPLCALALAQRRDLRAISLLTKCLNDDTARSAALYALRCYGRAACPALIGLLLDGQYSDGTEAPSQIDGRVAAARLLGELAHAGPAPAGALFALRAALNDPQRPVRIEAALSLSRQDGELLQAPAAVLTEALDEPNWARAQAIMQTLLHIGPSAGLIVSKAIAAPAQDEQARRRRLRAVIIAGDLRLSSAVPLLASLSYVTDRQLRLAAVTALAQVPEAGKRSLERFLFDREGSVRLRALEGLHERGALDPSRLAILLGDSDRTVRRAAEQFLSEQGSSALDPLKRIVCSFGSPLQGLRHRARLWWYACLWLVASRHGTLHPAVAARIPASSSSTGMPKIRR